MSGRLYKHPGPFLSEVNTFKMNDTYIQSIQRQLSQSQSELSQCDILLLVIAVVFPFILLCCVCILWCNIGGTLDCIFAAHRRNQQQKARKLEAKNGDIESVRSLLPITTNTNIGASASSSVISTPLRESQLLSPSSLVRPVSILRTVFPSSSSSSSSASITRPVNLNRVGFSSPTRLQSSTRL